MMELTGKLTSYNFRGMRSNNASTHNKKLFASNQFYSKRMTEDGFPVNHKFETPEEVREYLGGDAITCLQCGMTFKSLGVHLGKIHGLTALEYKRLYGLPFRRGLCAAPTRKLIQERTRAMTLAGIGACAAPRADRDEWRDRAHQVIRDGGMRTAHVTKKSRIRNLGPQNEWLREDYLRVIAKMKSDDMTAVEVSSLEGFPSHTMVRLFCSRNPDFNQLYIAANETLSFKKQAGAQVLSKRARDYVKEQLAAGLTQEEIGQKMGISQAAVSLLTLNKLNGHVEAMKRRVPLDKHRKQS